MIGNKKKNFMAQIGQKALIVWKKWWCVENVSIGKSQIFDKSDLTNQKKKHIV